MSDTINIQSLRDEIKQEILKELSNDKSKKIKQDKPKRKCTEKQLAALAAGWQKNPRLQKKSKEEDSE